MFVSGFVVDVLHNARFFPVFFRLLAPPYHRFQLRNLQNSRQVALSAARLNYKSQFGLLLKVT